MVKGLEVEGLIMSQLESTNPLEAVRRRAAYSNFAHTIVGVLLFVVSVAAGSEVLGAIRGGWRYFWPVLLMMAGLFIPVFILWVARRYRVPIARLWADSQQRQHFILSTFLFIGGLAELIRLRGIFPSLSGLVMPVMLGLIGYLFISHTQHGTAEAVAKAILAHRLLGVTLILAGLMRAIMVASSTASIVVGLAWTLLLLAAAIQLVLYREPEGAYSVQSNHDHAHDDRRS
jgi:hypothetical protein